MQTFTDSKQAGRTERVHPVLVPERVEQLAVETRLEVRNF